VYQIHSFNKYVIKTDKKMFANIDNILLVETLDIISLVYNKTITQEMRQKKTSNVCYCSSTQSFDQSAAMKFENNRCSCFESILTLGVNFPGCFCWQRRRKKYKCKNTPIIVFGSL